MPRTGRDSPHIGDTRQQRALQFGPFNPNAGAQVAPQRFEIGLRQQVAVLITEGLGGHDATDPRWSGDRPGLVRIFGEGLAAFHRAVGEEWCPFRFGVGVALEHVRRRAEAGLLDPAHQFHAEHRHLTVASAVALLEATAPDAEDLVVCHGDYCPPNVLLADGHVTGYVDLGARRGRSLVGHHHRGLEHGMELRDRVRAAVL